MPNFELIGMEKDEADQLKANIKRVLLADEHGREMLKTSVRTSHKSEADTFDDPPQRAPYVRIVCDSIRDAARARELILPLGYGVEVQLLSDNYAEPPKTEPPKP